MLGLLGIAFPVVLAVWGFNPVFWLESLALWAFGISWIVKGETVWQDTVP